MNRSLIRVIVLCALMMSVCVSGFAQGQKPGAKRATKKTAQGQASKSAAKSTGATARKGAGGSNRQTTAAEAEFAELLKLPAGERVARLQAFAEANPPAPLKARAVEHLVSAHAALGDERLQAGDAAGGIAEFRQALALAPVEMSDRLFLEVVAQFPANLFLRGQQAAAVEVARLIEEKVKDKPQRLLALAPFYLQVEQADEAARLAETALALAPELAAAHQARGAARRLQLRLDDAAADYKRALELDPKSMLSRRNLADLLRATGKPEDALALYREQLTADPNDRVAQAGVVLALLDAGKREDAERELEAALQAEPRNLPLLVGAGYWFAAHGDAQRALELASRAVQIEPRYTWAQITAARALVAQQRAADAERALRFARQYGRFPTLDYELASALAAAGLHEEAAEELAHAFALKDGQLETQLAGRVPAHAASFVELLAPERRASIFQFAPADTEANARALKGLFAFHLALAAAAENNAADDAALDAAAREFAAGDDDLRAFRQLYVADRLARRGVALTTALELAEAAKAGVEAAASTPVASVAVAADELRLMRARAIAAGGTPDFPSVSRDALVKILRGRTEELIGWALFNQGKPKEAAVALRRAVSVLPDGSAYARHAQWRLGVTLAAAGQTKDALAAYLKGYDRQSPDPTRRAVIESVYAKVHGSLAGLDALIGPAPEVGALNTPAANATNAPATSTPVATPAESAPPVEAAAPPATPTPSPADTSARPTEPTTPPTEAPTPTVETTKPQTETTTPPVEATAPPAETSARPVETSVKPVEVGVPPAEATAKPVEASATPANSPAPTPTPDASPTPTAESQPITISTPAAPTPTPNEPPPSAAAASPSPTPPNEATPVESERAPAKTDEKLSATNEKPAAANDNDEKPAAANDSAAATEKAGASKTDVRAVDRMRPRRSRAGTPAAASDCALVLSVESMLLTSNGGTSTLTASLEGQAGGATRILATTANWADIIVLREPQDPAPNAARYTVTSISRQTGTFLINFKSPCGTKELMVAVK
jgi:tetratricopeptide (TPR) repeat protein